jgi:hypothetical protein
VFWWEASVMAAATIGWVLILKEAAKELIQKLRDLRNRVRERKAQPAPQSNLGEKPLYTQVT